MRYSVEVTAEAERDIQTAFEHIRKHGPANPDQWKTGLAAKFETLETFPKPCGLAPESRFRSFPIYQTFYAKFRILFVIEDTNVFVITVRHGARKRMTRDEIRERL